MGVGWKSAFAVLFAFVVGGPAAPTGVERRSFGPPGPESGKAEEVALGLGLRLGLELNRRLVVVNGNILVGNCFNRGEEQVAQ